MTEDVEHRTILTKCLGPERRDSPLSRCPGQLVKKQCADPMVLILIGHHEGHLGFCVSGQTIKTTDGDQLIVNFGHQRKPIYIVDVGEVLHLLGGEFRMKGEETQEDRAGQEETMEGHQPGRVVGTDRSDVVPDIAVAHDIALEVPRVVVRHLG
jgi:hypothetical protein